MKIKNANVNIIFTIVILTTTACTGWQSFTTTARPGETIALAIGWHTEMTRDEVTVTITDANNTTIILNPGNPAVRGVINTYPDPLSNLIIGYETGQNIVGNEKIWGLLIEGNVTNFDPEWSQKLVILDLPESLVAGTATIQVSTTGGVNIQPQRVDIIDMAVAGISMPNPFINYESFSNVSDGLVALGRANHYTIRFSGATIPHAIQLDFTHAPDTDNGGSGRAYVVNTRGDIKSIHWSDNGTDMRVILLPTRTQTLREWSDFKFYVAGEITGLVKVPTSVEAFDITGNPVSGVTASVD